MPVIVLSELSELTNLTASNNMYSSDLWMIYDSETTRILTLAHSVEIVDSFNELEVGRMTLNDLKRSRSYEF